VKTIADQAAPAEALARIEAELAVARDAIAAELARPRAERDWNGAAAALSVIDRLQARMLRPLHDLSGALSGPAMMDPQQHRLRIAVHDARVRMAQWGPVRRCVLLQLRGEPGPLVVGRSPHDPLKAQQAILDAAFRALQAPFGPGGQNPEAQAYGCYPDIPMPASDFLALAHAAYRVALARRIGGPFQFLDVGCGGGSKVLLAAGFFDAADGLEFDPGYAGAARALFEATGVTRCRAIQGDALNFTGYGDYDVVYFYKPMSDKAKLGELEDRIVAGVRPGTVLIAPYFEFQQRSDSLGCRNLAEAIYVAGVTQTEADAIRDMAQFVGGAAVRAGGAEHPLGYWAPIVAASRANGFDPVPLDVAL
jgi:SAM-dependent methyltransferase